MTRLSRQEIASHQLYLTSWRPPEEMEQYVASVNDYMDSVDFFCQPGTQFLRDAWLAAQFAKHRRLHRVRLVPPELQWPDFEVQSIDGKIERVECVEADVPGRRRNDEYTDKKKNSDEAWSLTSPEDWSKDADTIPYALRTASQKKAEKNYNGLVSLMIYLNINEYGIKQKEVEACMQESVGQAREKFEKVYILWKNKLYGI